MFDHQKWQEFEDYAIDRVGEQLLEMRRLAAAAEPITGRVEFTVTVELADGRLVKTFHDSSELFGDEDGFDDGPGPDPGDPLEQLLVDTREA